MLRLVFLASIGLLSGCSCDALWGRYEVPCTRGFDCPDAGMPSPGSDGGDDRDAFTNPDGPMPPPGDMGPPDGGPNGDMPPLDGPGLEGGINEMGTKIELGVIML